MTVDSARGRRAITKLKGKTDKRTGGQRSAAKQKLSAKRELDQRRNDDAPESWSSDVYIVLLWAGGVGFALMIVLLYFLGAVH